MRQEAILVMPQPPQKTDGITKIQRREVIVEVDVEHSSLNPIAVPQIF